MYQITLNYAKTNLDELCDWAGQEPEAVAIVRENRVLPSLKRSKRLGLEES